MHPQALLHGSTEPLQDPLPLRAGDLSLFYERGFLRYLKVGDTEVLRMINFLIRDENWTTSPMTIVSESIDQSDVGFRIEYQSECVLGDIKYRWDCLITGKEDSSISFQIKGESLSQFRRNRLGLTVLHPIKGCAGENCTITHSDDSKEVLKFPDLIDPHQPFFDITEMRWNPTDRVEAQLKFEGDIFETEDQRNWSDASYKTYCTPLFKPFPVQVSVGDKVEQAVHFSVNALKSAVVASKDPLTFTLDTSEVAPFPEIGVCFSNLPHNEQAIEAIKGLGIDFLRVAVRGSDPRSFGGLKHASVTNIPLQVVVFTDGTSLESVVTRLLPFSDRIKQIIVLPLKGKCTNEELIRKTVPLLRKQFPTARIGGGTDAFFTELNRERTPTQDIDFLTFSLNPQAHASDNATVVENLQSQEDVIRSCREFGGGKDIHVGPITLKTRGNPAATSKDEGKGSKTLPPSVDARQLSLFGASWTLCCLKYLAESRVEAVTLFETCGWRGLLPHADQPWPDGYIDEGDLVYPVYVVLKEILSKRRRVVKLISNNPLTIDGLALIDDQERLLIFVANFSNASQSVAIPDNQGVRLLSMWEGHSMASHIANPSSKLEFSPLMKPAVTIPPYGICVLQ